MTRAAHAVFTSCERNDLALPDGALGNFLGNSISHVGRTERINNSDDSEHNFRAIIKPACDKDNEIAAINELNTKCQAITTPIKIPNGGYRN
ncbi:unnamed protein product [Dibothriocephalus latus]|uniref:Uncharacterized protein n=1 Tax=Dibothriocephalus latus TaxID=60516 RepID=A0A3P7LDV5_DIBLA|nr:unnamed protein product [Dibothriocephalus latus]